MPCNFSQGKRIAANGAAGALGKLDMATGSLGLIGQIFDDIFDPHTSIASRLDNLHLTINAVCNLAEMKTACAEYERKYHPNFPTTVPLAKPLPTDTK
jgi:hypothetical protein